MAQNKIVLDSSSVWDLKNIVPAKILNQKILVLCRQDRVRKKNWQVVAENEK